MVHAARHLTYQVGTTASQVTVNILNQILVVKDRMVVEHALFAQSIRNVQNTLLQHTAL